MPKLHFPRSGFHFFLRFGSGCGEGAHETKPWIKEYLTTPFYWPLSIFRLVSTMFVKFLCLIYPLKAKLFSCYKNVNSMPCVPTFSANSFIVWMSISLWAQVRGLLQQISNTFNTKNVNCLPMWFLAHCLFLCSVTEKLST